MATYKRRIVYLSDEDWAKVRAAATREGSSISEYIRGAVTTELAVEEVAGTYDVRTNQRREPERHFTEFRPAPKPGRT